MTQIWKFISNNFGRYASRILHEGGSSIKKKLSILAAQKEKQQNHRILYVIILEFLKVLNIDVKVFYITSHFVKDFCKATACNNLKI